MRKITLTLIVALFCSLSLFAQNPVSTTAADDIPEEGWVTGGEGIINFSNTSYTNGVAGVFNTTAVSANLGLFAKTQVGKWAWDNTAKFVLGGVNTEQFTEWRKADDLIDIDSKVSRSLTDKLGVGALFTFDSQFAVTRDFTVANEPITANFLAPAIIAIGVGIDWKPRDNFSVYFSPLTYRGLIVSDQDIANTGRHGNVAAVYNEITGALITPGQTFKSEAGANLKAALNQNLAENINWVSTMELFSNFLENKYGENKPQNIDVNWLNTVSMTVNKFIKVTLENQLRYDDEVSVIKNRGEADEYAGKGLQSRSFIGVGFTYTF